MTNRHMTAGIMSIISGALGALGGLMIAVLSVVMLSAIEQTIAQQPSARGGGPMPADILKVFQAIYVGSGVVYALIGVVGIIGGIFALKRKHWGLALAGAIAGSIVFYPVGIVGVIFASMAHPEFQTARPDAMEPKQPLSQIPGLPSESAFPGGKP